MSVSIVLISNSHDTFGICKLDIKLLYLHSSLLTPMVEGLPSLSPPAERGSPTNPGMLPAASPPHSSEGGWHPHPMRRRGRKTVTRVSPAPFPPPPRLPFFRGRWQVLRTGWAHAGMSPHPPPASPVVGACLPGGVRPSNKLLFLPSPRSPVLHPLGPVSFETGHA